MIDGIGGKGDSWSLQYICRMTQKTSVNIIVDTDESSSCGSVSLSQPFAWNEIFNRIDADGDGTVSIDEFEKYFSRVGDEKSGAADIVQTLVALFENAESVDISKEGARTQASGPLTPESGDSRAAESIFKIIDTDNDGSITRDELINARELILKRMQNAAAHLKLELTEAFLNMLEISGSIGPPGGTLASKDHPSIAQTDGESRDRVYHKTDANMDGEVSRDELQKALSQVREKRWRGS